MYQNKKIKDQEELFDILSQDITNSLGSKGEFVMNAASHLNAFKDVNIFLKGIKSLISKPYRQGIVNY